MTKDLHFLDLAQLQTREPEHLAKQQYLQRERKQTSFQVQSNEKGGEQDWRETGVEHGMQASHPHLYNLEIYSRHACANFVDDMVAWTSSVKHGCPGWQHQVIVTSEADKRPLRRDNHQKLVTSNEMYEA